MTKADKALLRWAIDIAIESETDLIACHVRFGKIAPEDQSYVDETRDRISRLGVLKNKLKAAT